MAFQDFDQISERRRLERKQKLRQKIIIGVVLTILLISGAVAAFLIFLNSSQPDDTTTDEGTDNVETNPVTDKTNKDNSSGASNDKGNDDQKLLQTQKAVQTICQTTDYKETCESRLEQSLSSKLSGLPSPDDLMQAAISAASDELDNAIKQTSTFMKVESAPEKQKPTFDVCKQVLEGAQNDFNHSRNAAGSTDLGNWLSGVMSYQQTCIDAVTENATKTSIEKALKITKELTSNSLAIASSLQKVVSPPTATHRRLLTSRSALPAWMTLDTRRLLKTDATSLAPNVTVAKDGKGDFETITKALEAIPDKYEGRYVIHIKKGVYEENVVVTKDMANITMYGDGSQKTIVTGDKNFADGVPTFLTATFDKNLQKWLKELQITQTFTSVAHPQGNGEVERANRSIVEGIKKRLLEHRSGWVDEVPHVLWANRTLKKTSTGETPFSLTYGTEAMVPVEIGLPSPRVLSQPEDNEAERRLDLMLTEERRDLAAMREENYKRQMQKYYNTRVKFCSFNIGDYILRNNEASNQERPGKLAPVWEGPYIIKEVLGKGAYRLERLDGTPIPRTWNGAQLRKCYM